MMPPGYKYSIPGGDTTVNSEVKTSSRPQQFSDVMKQKLQSPRADNIQKSHDKERSKSPFRQRRYDEHRPARITGEAPTFRTKSIKKRGNDSKADEKDELVKHMWNLPGYLQKVEKVEDKALNFGVLDWNRLEKWKFSDSGLPRGNADMSSSGSSLARHQRQQPSSHSSRPYLGKEKGFPQEVDLARVKVIENNFTTLRNKFNEHKNPQHLNMPSSKNISGTKIERGMRRDSSRRVISEKETSSLGLRKNEIPNSRKNVTSAQRKVITSRGELLLQSSECLNVKKSSDKEKSLVLILPKHSQKPKFQDIVHASEPILSCEGNSKEVHKGNLSAEVSSEEFNFEPPLRSNSPIKTISSQDKCTVSTDTSTPKAKPLRGIGVDTPKSLGYEIYRPEALEGTVASPSRRFSFGIEKISRSFSHKEKSAIPGPSMTPVAVKSEPSHRLSFDDVHSSGELYSYIPHSCPLPAGNKTNDELSTKLQSLKSVGKTPKKQTSENVNGSNEFDAVQNRHSSPNRRFSFSLGKMKRSLSFKEGLNIPLSGPVKSEVSDYSVAQKENKDSKSRSSPLRRLLDPLLKARASYTYPSTETSPSLKQNPNSFSEIFDKKKPEESVVQALLQVTTKNGLPLFKLVVNNGSDILVAMKNITIPGKQVVDSIYTFYSVHEIKKKSGGWINQVHKEKSYGFGYNVAGQMKGSSVDNFEDRYTQKEFVLYSVDRKQGDGEAPELVPTRELASIIVRVPHEKSSDDGDERNIGKELTGKDFFEYLEGEKYLFGKGETEKFHDTTVILSGADHGLPKNGVPSSLIQRWRSGGSCDCGGWDTGCKLQILTNEDQSGSLPESSVSSSKRDCFKLFNQRGSHDSKPIFKLAPFKKGIYSIEFSASISLLQALSTCIAAISSRQSFDLWELNFLPEGKLIEDSTFLGCGGLQISSKAQKSPGKCVPSPPASPVGRV